MMKKALYAGSFDPPTLGHLDIIKRASHLFESLTIGLAQNVSKQDSFLIPRDQRVSLLKEITKDVEVIAIDGLITEYAKQNKIDCLIRAIRSASDLEMEMAHAQINRKLTGIETLFLAVNPEYSFIHSSLIREAAAMGSPLHHFIPKAIEEKVRRFLTKK